MKILAIIEDLPRLNFEYCYGRYVLNSNFIFSLLKYSKFQEIHFFVTDIKKNQETLKLLKRKEYYNKIKIKSVCNLRDEIKNNNYVAIHTNMFLLLDGLSSIRNSLDISIPLTALTATITYNFYNLYYLTLLQKLQTIDTLIVPSNSSFNFLNNIFKQLENNISNYYSIEQKHNVNFEIIPYGIEKIDTIKRQKSNKDVINILIFGRLSRIDKFDILPLLPIFNNIIKTTKKKVIFIISGDCNDDEYLQLIKKEIFRLKIQKFVQIKIKPSESEKNNLFQSSNVFVSLSDNIQESFGLTLLEAMKSGLPLICSEWDGYKDLVKNGVNGFLVKSYKIKDSNKIFFKNRELSIFPFNNSVHYWGQDLFLNSQITFFDYNDFFEKLLKIIENDNLRNKLSKASKRIGKQYEWKKIIGKYDNLWLKNKNKKISKTKFVNLTDVNGNIYDSFYSEIIPKKQIVKIKLENIKKIEQNIKVNLDNIAYLRKEIIIEIIKLLNKKELSINNICKKFNYEEDLLTFNISWLLKNNYLEIVK